MKQSSVTRVTCPSCRLQFEPSGRNARCPVCGARVSSSVEADRHEPLPPLPEGLRAKATGAAPMIYERETRKGLVAACLLLLFAGIVMAGSGATDRSDTLIVIGLLLVAVAIASSVASKGWQVTSDAGITARVADLPIYLGVLCALILSVSAIGTVFYAVFQLNVAAGVVLCIVAVVIVFLGATQWGAPPQSSQRGWRNLLWFSLGNSIDAGRPGNGALSQFLYNTLHRSDRSRD